MMIDVSKLFVNLDVVLNKRTTLGNILAPYELNNIISKAKKNNWDDDTILEYVNRYIKENVSDFIDNSDFLDANIIVEHDDDVIIAMNLIEQSQRDAEKLFINREDKYPGCWINSIVKALKNLDYYEKDRISVIWDAYYNVNIGKHGKIKGWKELADVLESYYDSL